MALINRLSSVLPALPGLTSTYSPMRRLADCMTAAVEEVKVKMEPVVVVMRPVYHPPRDTSSWASWCEGKGNDPLFRVNKDHTLKIFVTPISDRVFVVKKSDIDYRYSWYCVQWRRTIRGSNRKEVIVVGHVSLIVLKMEAAASDDGEDDLAEPHIYVDVRSLKLVPSVPMMEGPRGIVYHWCWDHRLTTSARYDRIESLIKACEGPSVGHWTDATLTDIEKWLKLRLDIYHQVGRLAGGYDHEALIALLDGAWECPHGSDPTVVRRVVWLSDRDAIGMDIRSMWMMYLVLFRLPGRIGSDTYPLEYAHKHWLKCESHLVHMRSLGPLRSLYLSQEELVRTRDEDDKGHDTAHESVCMRALLPFGASSKWRDGAFIHCPLTIDRRFMMLSNSCMIYGDWYGSLDHLPFVMACRQTDDLRSLVRTWRPSFAVVTDQRMVVFHSLVVNAIGKRKSSIGTPSGLKWPVLKPRCINELEDKKYEGKFGNEHRWIYSIFYRGIGHSLDATLEQMRPIQVGAWQRKSPYGSIDGQWRSTVRDITSEWAKGSKRSEQMTCFKAMESGLCPYYNDPPTEKEIKEDQEAPKPRDEKEAEAYHLKHMQRRQAGCWKGMQESIAMITKHQLTFDAQKKMRMGLKNVFYHSPIEFVYLADETTELWRITADAEIAATAKERALVLHKRRK
jgi:hypothetical protein